MPGPPGGIATEPAPTPRELGVDDRQLARRAECGDPEAFAAIFRRYEQDLYRFCVGILGEPQDAQDALQNTMVKVMRALPGDTREVKLKPWLYRIAHNEAIELRRRQRRTDPLETTAVADPGATLEDRAEADDRLRKLFEDMADLPQRQRAALVMRELNGLEFGEIAGALGTSAGAVRQALYEARRGLHEMKLGREMRCDTVASLLSEKDSRLRGRRDVRAHLRECPDCRHFLAEVEGRKQTLAAISPLPAVALAAIAKSVLGGSSAAGLGAGAGAAATGAGGAAAAGGGVAGGGAVAASIGATGLAKSVAGILAVVAIGTATADQAGLVHLGGKPTASGGSHVAREADPAARSSSRPHVREAVASVPPAGSRHGAGEPTAGTPHAGPRAANPSDSAIAPAHEKKLSSLAPTTGAPTIATPPAGSHDAISATGGPAMAHPEHPDHPAHPESADSETASTGAAEQTNPGQSKKAAKAEEGERNHGQAKKAAKAEEVGGTTTSHSEKKAAQGEQKAEKGEQKAEKGEQKAAEKTEKHAPAETPAPGTAQPEPPAAAPEATAEPAAPEGEAAKPPPGERGKGHHKEAEEGS